MGGFMQKHRKKFKIGLAFLVVVALILFIGDWAFADSDHDEYRKGNNACVDIINIKNICYNSGQK